MIVYTSRSVSVGRSFEIHNNDRYIGTATNNNNAAKRSISFAVKNVLVALNWHTALTEAPTKKY